MAVEIRELVIRAIITKDEQNDQGRNMDSTSPGSNQDIIQECVNQVLKIMKQNQNR